jgi:FAD/FMN-containing dehydrogenase
MINLIDDLKNALGSDIVKTGDEVPEHQHTKDFALRGVRPFAVAYPRSAGDVSVILRLCNQHHQAVVPQGGMTGLAGGAVAAEGQLALSLSRMGEIEEIDLAAGTMTVQAGVALQTVQEAADRADMLFPLDLGGRGSCQVGGMASTNAGGNRVLRYGMARALILGLEAVLPDGTIINNLNKMLKNNAGYDLKQLFIGSEGTLGVITRLILRIFPKPRSVSTALCSSRSYADVLAFLQLSNQTLAGALSAFEVMWADFYEVAQRSQKRGLPLPSGEPFYVLVEALGGDPLSDKEKFEGLIARALEDGVLTDGVVAQSLRDAEAFWALRDSPGEFRQTYWPNTAFDVSLPIGEIDDFVEACRDRLRSAWPDVNSVYFGHIADSNIHIVVQLDQKPFPKRAIEEIVYETVRDYRGSVSAEHGIGVVKLDFLEFSRTPEEIALMRTLKLAIDPHNILNPGKVLGDVSS